MAKTPAAALAFMDALVPVATAKASREGKELQALIDAQRGGFTLEPWDWDFYGEQLRRSRYDLNDEEVKPYFELNNVLENGVFYAAHQLYGISFNERKDLPVYEPDVRVFEVSDTDGKPLALFYCDYFKRDDKNGGAWMSSFVGQSTLLGTRPVIYNVANFAKPAPGEPALLSFDDVRTLFHEFGHALHGMFADTRYPSLSGTATARDFVEFPSQFNEYWALYPQILNHYARHYKTGELMPERSGRQDQARGEFQRRLPAHGTACRRRTRHAVAYAAGLARRCRIPTTFNSRRWQRLTSTCMPCRRAIGRAISAISGVAAIRRVTTRTCGRKCSPTMPMRGSRSTAA